VNDALGARIRASSPREVAHLAARRCRSAPRRELEALGRSLDAPERPSSDRGRASRSRTNRVLESLRRRARPRPDRRATMACQFAVDDGLESATRCEARRARPRRVPRARGLRGARLRRALRSKRRRRAFSADHAVAVHPTVRRFSRVDGLDIAAEARGCLRAAIAGASTVFGTAGWGRSSSPGRRSPGQARGSTWLSRVPGIPCGGRRRSVAAVTQGVFRTGIDTSRPAAERLELLEGPSPRSRPPIHED